MASEEAEARVTHEGSDEIEIRRERKGKKPNKREKKRARGSVNDIHIVFGSFVVFPNAMLPALYVNVDVFS